MKAFARRLVDSALRRLGLVRAAVAALQTVEAIYLSTLGRPPEINDWVEKAAALRRGELTPHALVSVLGDSVEAQSHLLDIAAPAFESAGYLAPQAHAERLIAVAFLAVLGRLPDPDALSAYESALRTGFLSADTLVAQLASTQEAELRALNFLKPVLQNYGYVSPEQHYGMVTDAIFRSIIGRPLDDLGRQAFSREFIAGRLNLETAIEQLINCDELRLRILNVGLPDVLEGIYRALRGAPETDPALRSLIRSAASQRTFEMIKRMSVSAEASHHMMRPIIEAHRQQFLAEFDADHAVNA